MANTTTKPTEKKVKIKIPLTRKEQKDVFVGVNGRNFQIKRGVTVEVPECVAEVLQNQEEMLGIAMEYESKAAERAEN